MSEQSPNQAGQPHDVFISYASQDAATANSMVEALERQGIKCWIAPRDVTPGSQYADEIVGAINEAPVLVLVLSRHAVASSHVGREIERAASKRRRLVALRTDAAPLTRALEYFLSESQWIDAAALGMPAALAKLAQAVARALSAPSQMNPVLEAGLADSGTPTTIRPVGVKRMALAAVSLIALAAVVALGVHFWPTKRGDAQASTGASISDKSIAVLPFADMSQKKDQEYFGDGMAEEILDLLAKIQGLTVIGRTSSFQFKGKNEDLRTIGTKLNAAYVLEGSVRNSGDKLRVTAQLIGTRDGSHIWSESYNENVGDALQIQDRVAAGIVRALQVSVGAGNLRPRVVPNERAYDLYLRGRHSYDRFDKSGFEEAARYFRQSLAIDPQYVPAAEWLAEALESLAEWGLVAPAKGFEEARVAVNYAVKLDPHSAMAHTLQCAINIIYDWKWEEAERECKTALTIEPQNPMALGTYNQLLASLGRYDEAEKAIADSLLLDPMDASSHVMFGRLLRRRGVLNKSEAEFRKALDISPTYDSAHFNLAETLMLDGRIEEARSEFSKETDLMGREAGMALVYHAMNRDDLSDAAIAKMTEDWASGIASAYAFRGDKSRAFAWLDRAYDLKDSSLAFIKDDPMFDGIANDARFKAFLKKMNLPE